MQLILFTGCEMDIVFMVDTSGSIRDDNIGLIDNFQLMLNFVKSIVQLLPISSQESLVGMIGFSNDAYLEFNVQEYPTITALIDSLYYYGETTNTASALELLLNSAQNGTMGLRPGIPHIAILITDGSPNVREAETVLFAERVRASNIFQMLLVVGISPQVDSNELEAIAGDPSNVFYSLSFGDLSQLPEALSLTLCDGEFNLVTSFAAAYLHYNLMFLLISHYCIVVHRS